MSPENKNRQSESFNFDIDTTELDSLLGISVGAAEDPADPPALATGKKRGAFKHCTEGIHSRCIKRRQANVLHRAWSESKLLDILDYNLEEGHSYHCISGGDVDSLSYLKVVIRQNNPLDYCLFSTWCMADDDVLQFREWLLEGKIKRLDAYVGEIFPNSYRHEYAYLKEILAKYSPGGRVCVFKNHSKIFAGSGPNFQFAIESSANINTNPRTENTTITVGADIYEFYKNFFDDIKSFTSDYPDWEPYQK